MSNKYISKGTAPITIKVYATGGMEIEQYLKFFSKEGSISSFISIINCLARWLISRQLLILHKTFPLLNGLLVIEFFDNVII